MTQNVKHTDSTERIFAYEFPWFVAGFVEQPAPADAVFGGVLPMKVQLFHRYLSVEGGVLVATTTVPNQGTYANFTARAYLRLTSRFAVTYWHWSNGNLGEHNPSIDSVGVSVQVRSR